MNLERITLAVVPQLLAQALRARPHLGQPEFRRRSFQIQIRKENFFFLTISKLKVSALVPPCCETGWFKTIRSMCSETR